MICSTRIERTVNGHNAALAQIEVLIQQLNDIGHTAAELIHLRADASQPHMGLTSYKGEEVHKGDVTVAKNYLTQD